MQRLRMFPSSLPWALCLLLVSISAAARQGPKPNVVGIRGHVGCKENPKTVDRLRIDKPGVYGNILVEGNWGTSTLVEIRADDVTLRHCEIRNGIANAIFTDRKNVVPSYREVLARGLLDN